MLELGTTSGLIERLTIDRALRRLCDFPLCNKLPSESTFSRAFDEFAEGKLAERVHEALIKAHRSETLIGHIRRDGTASVARGEVQRPRRQDRRERLQAAPELGHAPLIDHNPRQGEKIEFAPAQAIRYHERTAAERSNARLKDEFGGNSVMVKGNDKVMSHRMFGILSLSADPLMRLRH